MLKIFRNRKAIADHLKEVINSPSNAYTKSTFTNARKLRDFLVNKNVISLICQNLDIQSIFKEASLVFQQRHGCVIGTVPNRLYVMIICLLVQIKVVALHLISGHSKRRLEIEAKLKSFINGEGDCMKELLKKSYCYSTKEEAEMHLHSSGRRTCDTLDNYERLHVVYENDYIIENDVTFVVTQNNQKSNKKFERLSEIRKDYITKILENLNSFFPTDMLKDFDVLDHR